MASNFFDKASLVMVPDAPFDGTLPSVKPFDRSGDFTFSRGSNLAATRVGPDGNIEKGRENLLLQSNQFDTTWTTSSATLTSGQADKDGGTDAWKFDKSAWTFIGQSSTLSGINTFSVYAKAGTLSHLLLYVRNANDGKYFDLVNGVIEGDFVASPIDAKIESVGNGWYRCSITTNDATNVVRIYSANADGDTSSTSGNIYIQNAQLEYGLVATDYLDTKTTTKKAGVLEDEPRIDFTDSDNPSLLLEPQRTNNLGQSEYFDGFYSKFASGITYDTNTSETTSPEGLYNATKLISSTNNEQQAIYKSIAVATPTFTCYAKAGEFDTFALKLSGSIVCNFTLTGNGSIGYNTNTSDKSITPVGNGWYRCSISATTDSVYAWIAIAGGNTQGDGTSGIYIYGAQLEVGSYPTSYIPTYGSTVTRSNDDADNTDTIDTDNDFTFMIESRVDSESNLGKFFNGLGYLNIDSNGFLRFRYSSTNYATNGDFTQTFKWLLRKNSTKMEIFLNGAKLSYSITTLPTGSKDINLENGYTKQFIVFPTALTDSECIALTTI